MQKNSLSQENLVSGTSTPNSAVLQNLNVIRGETQKHVNYKILEYIIDKFDRQSSLKVLDLPCGGMHFLTYLHKLFPNADLYGADIKNARPPDGIQYIQMDLMKEFVIPEDEKFDLITSISGIMQFSNTLSFISNCARRLKNGGTFIITNDNASTVKDKISFLLLGHHRIFKVLYEDSEELTQNVSIQEVCRLLRTHGLEIEDIKYTSAYAKDIIYFPIALLVYPIQWLYLLKYKTKLPRHLKWKMYPFKYCFCKHYIITTKKISQ